MSTDVFILGVECFFISTEVFILVFAQNLLSMS